MARHAVPHENRSCCLFYGRLCLCCGFSRQRKTQDGQEKNPHHYYAEHVLAGRNIHKIVIATVISQKVPSVKRNLPVLKTSIADRGEPKKSLMRGISVRRIVSKVLPEWRSSATELESFKIKFFNSGQQETLSAKERNQTGIRVSLPRRFTSEIVKIWPD